MNCKQLKIFAVCSMVFDHVIRIFPLGCAFAPLADALWEAGYLSLSEWVLNDLTLYLMYIGRLAAPIFLYCVTLGFVHTSDIRRYLGRILLTAVLSQVPYTLFDLAESRVRGITGSWRETSLNILFTLTLGLLVLAVHKELARRKLGVLSLAAVAGAAWLAAQCNLEGGKGYIILIFAYYILRDRPRWQKALLYAPVMMLARRGLVLWAVESIGTEMFSGVLRNTLLNVLGAYLGMLVTLAYNGEKGDAGKGFRRFMYAFYPVHFAVLALAGFLRNPL